MRRRDAVFRRCLAVADAIAIGLTLYVGTIVLGDDTLTLPIVGAFLLLVLLMKVAGLYDRDAHLLHKTTLDEVPQLFQVATLSALLLWLAGDVLLMSGDYGRRQIFGMWALLFGLLIVGRSLARLAAGRATPVERCLIVGDAGAAAAFKGKIELTTSVRAEEVGWVPLEPASDGEQGAVTPRLPEHLAEVLSEQQVHRVVVAPGHIDGDALLYLVRQIRALNVAVSVLPATPPVTGSSVEVDYINGLSLLGVRSFEMTRSSRLLKRAFDLVASSVVLLLTSPLLLAIALAIKVDSRGPVLFTQRRIGRDGEPFEMLKFRTMRDGAHAERAALMDRNEAAGGLFKIERDPRMTRVGRMIRPWSLDELPQLVNVLRGEMSLVGPRPLIPEEDSMVVGRFRRRLDLAPGITGYWQTLGSVRVPLAEMIRLDYLYVATWSLWNDIRVLLRTVPHVLGRRGW